MQRRVVITLCIFLNQLIIRSEKPDRVAYPDTTSNFWGKIFYERDMVTIELITQIVEVKRKYMSLVLTTYNI